VTDETDLGDFEISSGSKCGQNEKAFMDLQCWILSTVSWVKDYLKMKTLH